MAKIEFGNWTITNDPLPSKEKQQDDGDDFRKTLVQAWITTKLERDKSLLTVASAGVGLLITLLQVFGGPASFAWLYWIAFGGFLSTILSVVYIFKRNASYIEGQINGEGSSTDPVLTVFDFLAVGGFLAGIVASASIGVLLLNTSPTENGSEKGKGTSQERSEQTGIFREEEPEHSWFAKPRRRVKWRE